MTEYASFEKLQKIRNRNFVSPAICQALFNYGISPVKKLYSWFIINDGIAIRTIMTATGRHLHEGGASWDDNIKASACFEAFTIADMEAVLPPYTISKNAFFEYEVMLEKNYEAEGSFTSDRLPDALAKAVEYLVRKKKFPVTYVNKILNGMR